MNQIGEFLADPNNLVVLRTWTVKILLIILTLILVRVALSLGYLIIDRAFKVRVKPGKFTVDEKRANTLQTILKSVMGYIVYFIAAITILDALAVPIAAVLSAAGILGLAVGFGAQNLVKDVITGFFILFEDQFAVGEYIETEGVGGIVEDVGLRITKLRDWGGQLHIIPNGKITMVTNHNRGNMRALVEVGVAYEEDINRVLEVLNGVTAKMATEYQEVIAEGPKVQGIWKLGESEVVIRIVARTKPMEQWGIEMELRRRIKETFEREGIEIPYPRRVYMMQGREDIIAQGAKEKGGE